MRISIHVVLLLSYQSDNLKQSLHNVFSHDKNYFGTVCQPARRYNHHICRVYAVGGTAGHVCQILAKENLTYNCDL